MKDDLKLLDPEGHAAASEGLQGFDELLDRSRGAIKTPDDHPVELPTRRSAPTAAGG
jgi:hypothetical protein